MAYNNDPIHLNDGNKKLFYIHNKRQLYRIPFVLPSIIEEMELGIQLQHNIRFGRAVINGISQTSSLSDKIPAVFHNGYVIVAVELDEVICQSSNIETITNDINNARRGGQAEASIILAKSYINTYEEATVQLPPKLKLKNFENATQIEQEEILKSSKVFEDFVRYVYENKETAEYKRFF